MCERGTQPDRVYHVTTRSIAEEHIFKDGGDYAAGVTQLAGLVGEGFAVCHAFCFMPTHYHVIGSFDDVTKFVHKLNRRYAVAFNRRYKRRGHVFDSPPSLTPIESEWHLRRALRYVALNPPNYETWPYSSYGGTIGLREPFSFVDGSVVLEAFGGVAEFRRFVDEGREAEDL